MSAETASTGLTEKKGWRTCSYGMGKYVDCAAVAGGMSATAVLQGDTAHTTDEAKIKAASANQGGKRSANYDNSNPVTVASLPTV